MCQDSVLQLLRGDTELASIANDATLAGFELTGFVVEPFTTYDQVPNLAGAFMTIVWRTTDFEVEIQENGLQWFDLYGHLPIVLGTDYKLINAMFDRVDDLFAAVENGDPVIGGDGWQLEQVGFAGRGPQITDDGYMTICRQASYYAIGSKTA
ncbi:hypothetical protein [Mycobacterium malmoense]|uniref:hypothetical protein n=1 Tax=Mycobacterium malmoense TaxID=1780 RepID=UPI0008F91840|nr:hypothetical protein [Mycobacterium malmoense]OIN79345.1 hypothetical protein BMG05_18335 [Mycobacterium malmoense]